jgi:diguanylate cyclase (GGDEF)-like protein
MSTHTSCTMPETSAALLTAVVTATPEIAAFVSADGEVLWINPAFVTRWPCADKSTARELLHVLHPDDLAFVQQAWTDVSSGGPRTEVRRARLGCPDGSYDEGLVRLTRVEDGDAAGSIVIHVQELDGAGVTRGIDPLTGLVDRQGLMTELDVLLADSGCAGLALLDLDNFHLVNETSGHVGGDAVLIATARRLRAAAAKTDLVARMSADEFAVVFTDRHTPIDEQLAGLRAEVQRPLHIGEVEHTLSCSVGVASLDVMTGTIEALAAAESALFVAKTRGGGQHEVFDSGVRESTMRALRRTSELKQAAAEGNIVPRYQPIVDLGTGRTVGCEALLRWIHPTEGELAACDFLELAEDSGLVNELTESLLVDACLAAERLSRAWAGSNGSPYVSVNLSPRQLTDPRLVGWLDYAVQRAGIDPGQVMVEITESTMFTDVHPAVAALSALRQRGVRVALDDFGTGFSSLLRLRELPVDCLKIDRTFVSGIVHNQDDLAIVASVVHMTATLGIDCIAEGVETEDQLEELRRLGCGAAQGFLWSRAVAVDDVPLEPGTTRPRPREPRATAGVDESTQAWIMRLHRSGTSLSSIAAVLNQSGSRTPRGTRWHPRTVAQVVAKAAYPQLGR